MKGFRKGSVRKLSSVLIFPLFIFALNGCGYHIAGRGGNMPGGVKTISIPFLKNLTQRPGVETVLTKAIIDEFINTESVRVAGGDTGGEAVLTGVVKSYILSPVSFTTADVTQEYRLTIALELKLVRSSDRTVLWEDRNISDYEDFKVTTSDISLTKTAEWDALTKMAKDIARLVKERIVEEF